MQSTVIPVWHDIAKQVDWSAGSIFQWQAQSCEFWLPTRRYTSRLWAVFQQILKFWIELGFCHQLHHHTAATLIHRDSGERPHCLQNCLSQGMFVVKFSAWERAWEEPPDGGMSCCSTDMCHLRKLSQFCTAVIQSEYLKAWSLDFLMHNMFTSTH